MIQTNYVGKLQRYVSQRFRLNNIYPRKAVMPSDWIYLLGFLLGIQRPFKFSFQMLCFTATLPLLQALSLSSGSRRQCLQRGVLFCYCSASRKVRYQSFLIIKMEPGHSSFSEHFCLLNYLCFSL